MSSEMGDMWRDVKEGRRAIRDKFGVPCPRCPEVRPRAHPSILLPQQRCKVDGYVDKRPRITDEQYKEVTGWSIERGDPSKRI